MVAKKLKKFKIFFYETSPKIRKNIQPTAIR